MQETLKPYTAVVFSLPKDKTALPTDKISQNPHLANPKSPIFNDGVTSLLDRRRFCKVHMSAIHFHLLIVFTKLHDKRQEMLQ